MVNFQGYPHGSVIFALADVAFGAACNSHGEAAVALNVTIAFLDAVTPDATLIAEGREKKQGRPAGFYEIQLPTEHGAPVALAHRLPHRVVRRSHPPRGAGHHNLPRPPPPARRGRRPR